MDFFLSAEPVSKEPQVFSVSELTRTVREVLEATVGVVWVEGEISNYRKQASGHQYFTLKDAGAQLSCVLFARPGLWRKHIPLADGMQVQVRGTLTVYELRGQYQLNVQLVQAGGAGLLQARFEALKRKLDAEGLFDPALKLPLPKLPNTIAIVTSPTGAALRDMLNILSRRSPWVRILISPVRVQGTGAAAEIAAALGELNRGESGLPIPDVIVVGRGGGSVEDLWEFNEEIVARAIAASTIPVVSAIGHEIDFTIADFVADLRAPTPSAAAELIVPDTGELLRRIAQQQSQMQRCALAALSRAKDKCQNLAQATLFSEPRRRLDSLAQRLDAVAQALAETTRSRFSAGTRRVAELQATLRNHRPDQILALMRRRVALAQWQLGERARERLSRRVHDLRRVGEMLRLLSPESALKRGFSITTKMDGSIADSVTELAPGIKIRTRLHDGSMISTVEAVE